MLGAGGRGRLAAGLVALTLGACSPPYNWREVRPAGSDLVALFPCRPDQHVRTLELAGRAVEMRLATCEASGLTFAVSHVSAGAPAAATAALAALRRAALANIDAAGVVEAARDLRGKGAPAAATRVDAIGRLPSGAATQWSALFFARGADVYQATVYGTAPEPEVVETFFAGLDLS